MRFSSQRLVTPARGRYTLVGIFTPEADRDFHFDFDFDFD
jgi:hypothetical protein